MYWIDNLTYWDTCWQVLFAGINDVTVKLFAVEFKQGTKYNNTVKPALVTTSIKLVKPALVITSIKLVKPALVTCDLY